MNSKTKKIVVLILIIITGVIFAGYSYKFINYKSNQHQNHSQEDNPINKNPKSLKEYYQTIDYSCNTDSDCVIKDIHNCCGYYPACVNKDFKANPELVREICLKNHINSVCGFPSIDTCLCINNKCSSVYKGSKK